MLLARDASAPTPRWPARTRSSRCSAAQVAVGGQLLELQGLGGVYSEIFLPLHGEHQAHNAVVALAAVEAFFGAGADRQLDVDAVRAGFAAVHSPGRLERMRSAPTVFIDAAHNPAGAAALADGACRASSTSASWSASCR